MINHCHSGHCALYFGNCLCNWSSNFTFEVNVEVRPQCVICLEVLPHNSLKEAKLRRHLESKHAKYVDKNYDFFKNKELHVKRSRNDRPATWDGVACSHSKAVKASFTVAWKIARAKAAHTAGENLVKPAAVEMAKLVCGDAVASKLAMVPLSNNTHPRNIGKYQKYRQVITTIYKTNAAKYLKKNSSSIMYYLGNF